MLDEASAIESLPLMKCVGKVRSTDRKANYFSFTRNLPSIQYMTDPMKRRLLFSNNKSNMIV